ncbi:MAG: methylated-DNA--[protein]-cysteine S-methyltransferase [Vulcanimicrobiaceae bacterium]
MRCRDVEAIWDDQRDEFEPKRDDAVIHLRRCKTCQDAYNELEGVAYCLTCLPIVEPSQNLVPRILAHIAMLRSRSSPPAPDEFATVSSPLGELDVAWRGHKFTYVGFDDGEPTEHVAERIARRLRRPVCRSKAPHWVGRALAEFFRTWRADPEWIDASELSVFERAALLAAAAIPPGEVRSYGWIAREIGHPQAARAVGQVMARNPLALFFPCHRVVDASGSLHEYGYGLEMKARILELEGYPVASGRRLREQAPEGSLRTRRS